MSFSTPYLFVVVIISFTKDTVQQPVEEPPEDLSCTLDDVSEVCSAEIKACDLENACREIRDSRFCDIPDDIQDGPDECWVHGGFIVGQTPNAFKAWTSLVQCVLDNCILPPVSEQPPFGEIVTFGTGMSQGSLSPEETLLFDYTTQHGRGVFTHFWIAGTGGVDLDNAIVRYYLDGDTSPTLEFTPQMAVGVGNFGGAAVENVPWGTKWVGKGADSGAWYTNIRIPFQKTARVTLQSGGDSTSVVWAIVRGAENLPIHIGDILLPTSAKLRLFKIENTAATPLDFFTLVDLPAGTRGQLFSTSIAVNTTTPNFMEGCHHLFPTADTVFPGVILSTGTEDFFDSAFFFDAGEFRFPVSGNTFFREDTNLFEWSAYRFFDMDPIMFNNGGKFIWRYGDVEDPETGLKCILDQGGTIVGNPQPGIVNIYSWVYTF